MARLIDADVLKAIYDPSSYEGHDPNENWDNVISTFEEIRADIDDQPTVDAVPVVRCAECKYLDESLAMGGWDGSCRYWNTHSTVYSGFCSFGKKVTE